MVCLALNHITSPLLEPKGFCSLASKLGCQGIEVRSDVFPETFDKAYVQEFGAEARSCNINILTLSELGSFDIWNETRLLRAKMLAEFAVEAGIPAISLIPANNGMKLSKVERVARLRAALHGIQPVLSDHGLKGLIEPLGFQSASLRHKGEIVEVIEELNMEQTFKLIHDTFHHTLADEKQIFPNHTALVHISGVEDTDLSIDDMRDQHRVLVGPHDRLGTIDQIKQLQDAGYMGPVSFEPFSPMVQQADDLEAQVARSIRFIEDQVQLIAA